MFNDNEAATQYKMAHTSSSQYLKEVEEAIANKDGDVWAELISYKHPHVANPRLQLENGLSVCQRWFEPPYDEMVAAHLRGVWAVSGNDYSEAYAAQSTVVQYPMESRSSNLYT